jgi:hypothetical protein
MYRVCKLCGWQLQTGNGEDVQLASSVEPPLACVYPPVPATVIDNPAYCGDVAGWRGGCAIDQSALRLGHSSIESRLQVASDRLEASMFFLRQSECSYKSNRNKKTSQARTLV